MSDNNKEKMVIYTDGGSQGNPGPAAVGAVIHINGEQKEYNKHIEETTNNVAEYKAVIFGLTKLKELIGKDESSKKEVQIKSDSELLVKQMNGEYKIKNEGLQDLFVELWNLKQDFKTVDFELIPREENKAADRLVNDVLL